jgi:type I restriction enzyme S subunit
MNMPENLNEWRNLSLGKVISLEYGKSFPEKTRQVGDYAVYGSNGIIGWANKYLIDLYYALQLLDLKSLIDTTTKPGLNRDRVYEKSIPLPPIAVQERIVQILQKADDIRRKRREALNIAEAVLPALFNQMFGDPVSGSNTFPLVALEEIADVRSGVTKGRKLKGKPKIEVPYMRVANVQDGFLNLSEIKTIEVLPGDLEKYQLDAGDILMTEGGDPDKLGRGTIWQNEIDDCIHQNHIYRIRTDRTKLLPEYLAALLRSQYAKTYFLSCAKRSSNLASINSRQVKGFPIPLPPMELQEQFIARAGQFNNGAMAKLLRGLQEAETQFSALMQQAFTGELTAAWEAAHAEEIEARQRLHEQLPALLLLAFIYTKAQATQPNAIHEPAVLGNAVEMNAKSPSPLGRGVGVRGGESVATPHLTRPHPNPPPLGEGTALLITALMKYAFLAQMEGASRARWFHFTPYHYGPFSKEVYDSLTELQKRGLVTVEQAPDEGKTRISLSDPAQAAILLAGLPDSLKRDVQAIIAEYGSLEHGELLKTVYGKYPAYAKKSRLRSLQNGK